VNDKNLKTLAWFSNDYYNITQEEKAGTYSYVDLRYPMLNPEDTNTAVFKFKLFRENNEWDITPFDRNTLNKKNFVKFMERLKGV
jgi:inner membrane protein